MNVENCKNCAVVIHSINKEELEKIKNAIENEMNEKEVNYQVLLTDMHIK